MGNKIINLKKSILSLRISNTCQGDCIGCPVGKYNNSEKTTFYDEKKIKKSLLHFIDIGIFNSVMIISNNITQFKGLNKLISIIKEKGIKNISISGEENINKKFIEKIKNMSVKIIYLFNLNSFTHKNIIDFLIKFDIISNGLNKKFKLITINLNFYSDKKLIQLILRIFGTYKILPNGSFFIKGYILLENNKSTFDNKKRSVIKASYNNCRLKNYFSITDIMIEVNATSKRGNELSYFDLTPEGNIYIHKVPCVFGFYKGFPITNIYQKKEKILYDFKKYILYIDKKKSGDMGIICNNCIKSPYNYKNNILK